MEQHAEGVWKRSQLNRAKGSRGKFPLAESRGSASGGVWGNAPTVPRATSMPNALNKGAGSEASLPVTLRSLRSAPKLLFPTSVLRRAGWARPNSWSIRHSLSFPKAGDFAPAGASPTAKAVRIFAGRGCGRLFSYTNSHLKHGIRTASFPPRLCFVPLARTSSTPRFTQLCRNEKSAMLDAMF